MPARPPAHHTRGWLARRWHGEVPLARLFWRDMWGVASVLNLATGLLALALLAHGADAVLAVAVHFALLPLNLFLLAAVWRATPRRPALRGAALLWIVLVTLV